MKKHKVILFLFLIISTSYCKNTKVLEKEYFEKTGNGYAMVILFMSEKNTLISTGERERRCQELIEKRTNNKVNQNIMLRACVQKLVKEIRGVG